MRSFLASAAPLLTMGSLTLGLTLGLAASPALSQEEDLEPSDTPTTTTPATTPTTTTTPTTMTPAPTAEVSAAPKPASSTSTIHDRGGLFGIGLVLAPKIGGGLGSVFFDGLGATFSPSLEVGYLLPLPAPINRDIELFVEGAYAAPTTDQIVQGDDPRLADGSFHYTLTLHQWSLATGALYRIPVPLSWLRPTVSLAANTVFSRTVITGDAGDSDFATATEDAVDLGVVAAVGADFFVGPGAISVEVEGAWVPADRFVLRATSATAVGLVVGYRFFL